MPTIYGTEYDEISGAANVLSQTVSSFDRGAVGVDPNALASSARSAGIPSGAEPELDFTPTEATFSTGANQDDWRVRITSPSIFKLTTSVLAPLQKTNGMIFPYLPSITMSHTANYSQLDTPHVNYPFYAYKSSQVDEINITGKFTVQNQEEAAYWLACMHFLRVVSKMYFGTGNNVGNPPPIVILSGYGDFVYKDVSCVVKNFTITMPNDVDYISSTVGADGGGGTSGNNVSYVPTSSDITVSLQPVYSREKIKSFDLEAFAKGQLVLGPGGAFI